MVLWLLPYIHSFAGESDLRIPSLRTSLKKDSNILKKLFNGTIEHLALFENPLLIGKDNLIWCDRSNPFRKRRLILCQSEDWDPFISIFYISTHINTWKSDPSHTMQSKIILFSMKTRKSWSNWFSNLTIFSRKPYKKRRIHNTELPSSSYCLPVCFEWMRAARC